MSDNSKKSRAAPGGDTFVVDVKFRQNATWQGTVKCPDGTDINFRSTLELIKIMDSSLEVLHPEDTTGT